MNASPPTTLPIYEALPDVKSALRTSPIVVLQAPPGAGKSTALPLALLGEPWLGNQRILMLEPRRLAARAVAARMASVRGEAVGRTIGYRVRFEQHVSAQTRIEVLTEGILTRRLQSDPTLEGVGLVIFDEFHERSLHADLALALCREAQHALRDDLRLLIMSATLDGDSLRPALDNPPIISASGRQHPVTLHYTARDPEGPLSVFVADSVSRALTEHEGDVDGDVLAFLPGTAEIQRAQSLLAERHPGVALHPLYGELNLDAQQAAILPDAQGRRKVVLATSIAETSLTIEGVRVVVDSGYSRTPRFDSRTGLTRLETTRVTLDSANQRAGRAGRLGPGACYRLWSAQTHARLNPTRKPEILEADLAPLRLELAQWGVRDATELRWVTPPPVGALRQATELLQGLGALHGTQLSERGRAMLDWPTHPRLAHVLLEAQAKGGAWPALAADVAALLDERDPLPRASQGADLSFRIEALRHWRGTQQSMRGTQQSMRGTQQSMRGTQQSMRATQHSLHGADGRVLARIERVAAQWRKQLGVRADDVMPDPFDIGWLVSLAYPDRIAQARGNTSQCYRLANGRGVALAEGDPLAQAKWLAVAHLDAGTDEGRVYLAAPLDEDVLDDLAAERDVVGWDAKQGMLVAQRERRVGELLLSSRPISAIPQEHKTQTLCVVVRREGLALLSWTPEAQQWRARAQSLRNWRGDEWPDCSDDALMATLEVWLAPWLDGVTRRNDFAGLDVQAMLSSLLTHKQRMQLDVLAPTHVQVPSGSRIRLEYALSGAPPVLAVKLQEMFGLADTPTVNEGHTTVMLHLLSPAQRPIQVTQDLRSFWANTYPAVRKELRGRYNKHPWPEDPWNAVPTRRTVARM